MAEYCATLYRSNKTVRPNSLDELERRISTGIYRGGFIAQLMGKSYDDADLWERELVRLKTQCKPVHAVLLIGETNHLKGWNLNYEFHLAGAIEPDEFVQCVGEIPFRSDNQRDHLIKEYVRKYGGRMIDARIGAMAVYPAEYCEMQMAAMVHYFAR
ncbi:hypothetical protein HZB02_07625 [Candidatus Woesearchaeota archaeon]|nr:hypothetical protein [Candidatus Woesearchaeota archaeon]